MSNKITPVAPDPVPQIRPAADEERANRTLLKVVRMAHTLNEKEIELALVFMQAIVAWNGLSEAA